MEQVIVGALQSEPFGDRLPPPLRIVPRHMCNTLGEWNTTNTGQGIFRSADRRDVRPTENGDVGPRYWPLGAAPSPPMGDLALLLCAPVRSSSSAAAVAGCIRELRGHGELLCELVDMSLF